MEKCTGFERVCVYTGTLCEERLGEMRRMRLTVDMSIDLGSVWFPVRFVWPGLTGYNNSLASFPPGLRGPAALITPA